MSLRIQNNIAAMNAHRQLGISSGNMNKSLERLSSGFRINKAADDAAGLAISQQFRADIASYKVASRNTSEASSLLQVAEGSLDQMGNILTRLKELATQASSGNAGSNIEKINAEANELVEEFDRIATSTEYAGSKLLTGELAGTGDRVVDGDIDGAATSSDGFAFDVTGTVGVTGTVATLNDTIAGFSDDDNTWTIALATGVNETATSGDIKISNDQGIEMAGTFSANDGDGTITIAGLGVGTGLEITTTGITSGGDISGDTIVFDNLGLNAENIITANNAVSGGEYTFGTDDDNNITLEISGVGTTDPTAMQATVTDGEWTLKNDDLGITVTLGDQYSPGELDGLSFDVKKGDGDSGNTMTFQIGAQNETDNQLDISIADAQASAMKLTPDMLVDADAAQTALNTIDTAIGELSDVRGDVGAYMNRLAYAASNLATTTENVQASESVIRDVDMASEMTTFTKNQILMQAGTAMLSQANMAPQQVLSLFG